MEDHRTRERCSSSSSNSNSYSKEDSNEKINKVLLICYLWLITLLPQRLADYFQHIPSLYIGTLVFLAIGFFSCFLGFLRGDNYRFRRVCAAYSSICLGFVVILLSSGFLLLDSNLPFKKHLYFTSIALTNPIPIFVLLVVLLPLLLHFSLVLKKSYK